MGIHENEFGLVTDIGSIGVDPEDKRAFRIESSKAIAGEEERGLRNSQMGVFLAYEPSIHYQPLLHHLLLNLI